MKFVHFNLVFARIFSEINSQIEQSRYDKTQFSDDENKINHEKQKLENR